MSSSVTGGRLSVLAAAMVVARRDFIAVLVSRSFVFFLLGPIFMIAVAGLAGGVGHQVQESSGRAVIGLAMEGGDADAVMAARAKLATHLGNGLPEFTVIKRLKGRETFSSEDSAKALRGEVVAVLSGSRAEPLLIGPVDQIERWRGPVAVVAGQSGPSAASVFPQVALSPTASTMQADRHGLIVTAQAAQTLLFLLTMLLAGMVLSNLVEEKSNKVIEILAAAIPMDAVFLGKLFAMLAVSMVGIAVWSLAIGALFALGGAVMPQLPAPAVGWPLFIGLGVVYFAMAYLLLGSVFLTIGAMAATVREVQTLSMPVTMLQLLVFFLASFAMTLPGSALEAAAMAFPFSSPYMMVARAAQSGALWPHAAALAWQGLCVLVFVRVGARMFRKRVMHSGPANSGSGPFRNWLAGMALRRAA